MAFHDQSAVETTHLANLEEVPLTHEEAPGRGVFPRSRLIAGQPRPCRLGSG